MATLTFFRIKQSITDPDDIIVDRTKTAIHNEPVVVNGRTIGIFYWKRSVSRRPGWVSYIAPYVDLEGEVLGTASLAGVILIKEQDYFYAVVFGYGASLVKDEAIDTRFGLRATLNAVAPTELRSIDHKRLETTSRHTREQLTRDGDLGQFGLDVERDLLRAVVGTPTDPAYGTRMSGSDNLSVVADIPMEKLASKLHMYSELAKLDTYKTTFPWVDNISDVRDPTLEAELDRALVDCLNDGSDNIWLSPPEIIDWGGTTGFRYKSAKRGELYTDLSLEDYFQECGDSDGLDAGRRLQHDRIFHIRGENDSGQHSWPAIRCLVGEVEYSGDTYVLNEGLWYRVDHDFLGELDTYIANIPTSAIDLPDYADTRESVYCARAHARERSKLALLDQNFVRLPKRGTIEVCDLYSREKIFIHVKRMSASSTLSHLFAQGLVSAQLFMNEQGFREQFLTKIPQFAWGSAADLIPPNTFEVAYAIIQRRNRPLSLPFFSKISLRSTAQAIRQLGLKVSLVGIPST